MFRRNPLWAATPDGHLRQLLARVEVKVFQPGELLIAAGSQANRIFVLLEGAVRVFFADEDGSNQATVKLFWAPATFGEAECVLRSNWPECVEGLTLGRVAVFEAPHYFRVMSSDAATAFRHYLDVARRFGVAIAVSRAAALEDVQYRAIALLTSYANHFGKRLPDASVLIDYPLTQERLALELGSNRRTIVQVLGRLYASGTLRRSGRKFKIPDLQALLSFSLPAPLSLSYSVG